MTELGRVGDERWGVVSETGADGQLASVALLGEREAAAGVAPGLAVVLYFHRHPDPQRSWRTLLTSRPLAEEGDWRRISLDFGADGEADVLFEGRVAGNDVTERRNARVRLPDGWAPADLERVSARDGVVVALVDGRRFAFSHPRQRWMTLAEIAADIEATESP